LTRERCGQDVEVVMNVDLEQVDVDQPGTAGEDLYKLANF
jgi:hypothetical protein